MGHNSHDSDHHSKRAAHVKRRREQGLTFKQLGSEFGVGKSTAHRIAGKKTKPERGDSMKNAKKAPMAQPPKNPKGKGNLPFTSSKPAKAKSETVTSDRGTFKIR